MLCDLLYRVIKADMMFGDVWVNVTAGLSQADMDANEPLLLCGTIHVRYATQPAGPM